MKKLLLIGLVVFGCNLSFAQETCNSFMPCISPDGNSMYFSSDRSAGNYEIFKTDIDGVSNLQQLTSSSTMKLYPSVSPDGTLITFQDDGYGASAEIYIMNNDGSNLVRLTNNNRHDGFPNFSPDGTKIIFEAWDDFNYPEVFTMNLDGSDRTQLTNESGAYWQSAPIYNPSGTKIYFSAGFNADNYYVMMDLDGTNWVNITEPNTFGYAEAGLHFNLDGTKIIFLTTEYVGYNNGSDIIIANADGSGWNRITYSSNGEYFYGGVFHPDDGKIYYSYYPGTGGKYSIYKMDEDGTNNQKITNCEVLGIDEGIDNLSSLISPNPANDILNINLDNGFTLELYDITGKLILKSKEKQINISMLERSIYTIVLKDDKSQLIRAEKLFKL